LSNSKSKDQLTSEILELLDERYPAGLYEFMYKQRPKLYKELLMAEEQIDQVFINDESIESLKYALKQYWIIHIKGIDEFNGSTNFSNKAQIEPRKLFN